MTCLASKVLDVITSNIMMGVSVMIEGILPRPIALSYLEEKKILKSHYVDFSDTTITIIII